MSESTKDTIEINNPEYNFLPKNFLESVKDVFGNIKIDIELDINNKEITFQNRASKIKTLEIDITETEAFKKAKNNT